MRSGCTQFDSSKRSNYHQMLSRYVVKRGVSVARISDYRTIHPIFHCIKVVDGTGLYRARQRINSVKSMYVHLGVELSDHNYCRYISSALKNNPDFQTLQFVGFTITDEAAQIMAAHMYSLKKLIFRSVTASKGIKTFLDAIVNSTSLITLKLIMLETFDLESAIALAMVISRNQSLQILKVAYTELKSSMLTNVIFQSFQFNSTLQELKLDRCGITDAGMKLLMKTLSLSSTVLQVLELNDNPFSRIGYIAIADFIKQNATVKRLDISHHHYTVHGVYGERNTFDLFFDAIQSNSVLQDLNVSGCSLRGTALESMAKYLCINTSLTSLNISKCLINEGGPIARILRENKTLTKLHLGANHLSSREVLRLVHILCDENIVLQTLSLFNSKIGPSSLTIARILKNHKTLKCVDLRSNPISDEQAIRIKEQHSSMFRV
jgi:hypothetical protein